MINFKKIIIHLQKMMMRKICYYCWFFFCNFFHVGRVLSWVLPISQSQERHCIGLELFLSASQIVQSVKTLLQEYLDGFRRVEVQRIWDQWQFIRIPMIRHYVYCPLTLTMTELMSWWYQVKCVDWTEQCPRHSRMFQNVLHPLCRSRNCQTFLNSFEGANQNKHNEKPGLA